MSLARWSSNTGTVSSSQEPGGAASRTSGRQYLLLAALSLFLIVADQATKFWIRATIHETGPVVVIPGIFRLVHVENEGAAWGILSDATYRMPFFIVSTSVAFVVIGLYFSRLTNEHKVLRVALASILGGASAILLIGCGSSRSPTSWIFTSPQSLSRPG